MTATSVNSNSGAYIDMTCGMLWSTPISWVASSTTLGITRVTGSNGFSSDSALLFGLKSVSSMLISQKNNDKQGKRAAACEGFTLGGRNDGQQRSTIWHLKMNSYELQWAVLALPLGIHVYPVTHHHGKGIQYREWTLKDNGRIATNRNPCIEGIIVFKSMESVVQRDCGSALNRMRANEKTVVHR